NVYGYAATAAFGLQTANAGSAITMNMTNPVLIIILSTILGAVFGLLSAKLAGAIEKKA
ncbi:DUF1097 family protein, partial [Methylophaga sp. UBA1464]